MERRLHPTRSSTSTSRKSHRMTSYRSTGSEFDSGSDSEQDGEIRVSKEKAESGIRGHERPLSNIEDSGVAQTYEVSTAGLTNRPEQLALESPTTHLQKQIWVKDMGKPPKTISFGGKESQTESEEICCLDQDSDSDLGTRSAASKSIATISARHKHQSTQVTISDDRSRGSEFERTGRILLALRTEKKQSVAIPATKVAQDILQIHGLPPAAAADRVAEVNRTLAQLDLLSLIAKKGQSRFFDALQIGTMNLQPSTKSAMAEAAQSSSHRQVQHQIQSQSQDPNALVNENLFLNPHILGVPEASAVSVEALRSYIHDLQVRAGQVNGILPLPTPNTFQVIHRIIQSKEPAALYFDRPQWVITERNATPMLSNNQPLSSLSLHLARRPEIVFIVYRDYNMSILEQNRPKTHEIDAILTADHTAETLEPLTEPLTEALCEFATEQSKRLDIDGSIGQFSKLSSPYLPVYHSREILDEFSSSLEDQKHRQFDLLIDYILEQYGEEYKTVDDLIKRGKITHQYFEYLIKPGAVLVQGKQQNVTGHICKSWLRNEYLPQYRRKSGTENYQISVWTWAFQGAFSRKHKVLSLSMDTTDESEKRIDELKIRPLDHAGKDTKEMLRRRGETFWKCRKRHLVSYHEDTGRYFHHSGDDRYMIDLSMYRELHKEEKDSVMLSEKKDLDDEAMENNEPPVDNFVYLLPATLKGYNLKRKKWLDLKVSQIGDVVWNKEAFEGLVLEKKTKRLIQALISDQVEAEKGTDLISGKGNGLILLLHGGPGTGKTLTAESVAEIAQKPLYPVTCGDIGTEPEDVENYLESVFHLGKTWGCVVLLDEADVFLEQRSLEDLRRNALVSVFLRALEYYEGILILTSNRVGTFDEAFKSRIQLALHYANLSDYSRTKIWGNFIQRLQKLKEVGIDFDDLHDNIEKLAKNKMNGREIRNVITTARVSARWEKTTLNYEFLDGIIKTAGKFDVYLDKLNRGYTQDQLAADEGLRLAEGV